MTTRFTLAFACGLALAAIPFSAIAATTNAETTVSSVSRTFPNGSYVRMSYPLRVDVDPGAGGQQSWSQSGTFSATGGFILKLVTDLPAPGQGHGVVVTRHGATTWIESMGAAVCDEEGDVLTNCYLPYAWKPGITYRLDIEREVIDGLRAFWVTTVTDESTGVKTNIARTRTSSTATMTRTGTQSSVSGVACGAMPSSSVTWLTPEGQLPSATTHVPEISKVSLAFCPSQQDLRCDGHVCNVTTHP